MTKLTIAKLYKADKIDGRIELLHRNGQKMQTEMHKLACSVLYNLGKTKDVRQVLKFINAMPEMARVNGLRAWFEKFGCIAFHEDDNKVVTAKYVRDKTTDVGAAIEKPFWKFSAKEGAPYEPLDMQKWASATLQKLRKDTEKTGADHTALIAAIEQNVPSETQAHNAAKAADPMLTAPTVN